MRSSLEVTMLLPLVVARVWVVTVAAHLIASSAVAEQTGSQATEPVADLSLEEIAAEAESLRKEQTSVATQLLEEFPDEFDAWRIIGYVHSSQGNLSEMAECWRKCRGLQPDRADIHDQLGRYAYQTEDYEAAIESWRRTQELQPSFPGVRQRIGSALLELGQTAEARDALQAAVEVEPRNGQAHLQLGDALFQLGDFQLAKQSYATASTLMPENPKTFYGLMKTCTRLGNREEMQEYAAKFRELQAAGAEADRAVRKKFDDLQQMHGHVSNTLIDAGRFYAGKNNVDRAEQLWLRAAELDAANPTPHKLLLAVYEQQDEPPKILGTLLQLARIQPRDGARWQRIGFLSARLGDMKRAEIAFRNAIAVNPQDAAAYRALAKFYLNTKRAAQQARQLAAKAVELDPVAESYFVLGWADLVSGDRVSAIQSLDRAQEIDPNNRNYQMLRQAAEQSRPDSGQ